MPVCNADSANLFIFGLYTCRQFIVLHMKLMRLNHLKSHLKLRTRAELRFLLHPSNSHILNFAVFDFVTLHLAFQSAVKFLHNSSIFFSYYSSFAERKCIATYVPLFMPSKQWVGLVLSSSSLNSSCSFFLSCSKKKVKR